MFKEYERKTLAQKLRQVVENSDRYAADACRISQQQAYADSKPGQRVARMNKYAAASAGARETVRNDLYDARAKVRSLCDAARKSCSPGSGRKPTAEMNAALAMLDARDDATPEEYEQVAAEYDCSMFTKALASVARRHDVGWQPQWIRDQAMVDAMQASAEGGLNAIDRAVARGENSAGACSWLLADLDAYGERGTDLMGNAPQVG